MVYSEVLVEDVMMDTSSFVSVEWLLQQLILCNGTIGVESVDGIPCAEEKIMDVEVDGFHYTLTRKWSEISVEKHHLSPREEEIVGLVAKGFPNKAIATVLNISPSTVATHIRRVFDKLNAKSRAEMVARVMERKV